MSDNEKPITGEEIPRRRGRPAGHNRVPLSLEERRARNAQYERERRQETTAAMSNLYDVVGCSKDKPQAELLVATITRIKTAPLKELKEGNEEIRRINNNLEAQLAMLRAKYGLDDEDEGPLLEGDASDADTSEPPPPEPFLEDVSGSSPEKASKKQKYKGKGKGKGKGKKRKRSED
ncbi:hypothetical protein PYW08_007633 [Mythimna loreyi]|uniref:Uncharacterized protein n=1 Tax=Mythimna loreyi TaxID=667449 RepID=A0ACC2QE79_9NEOP|nr:hypothetical protein PYW08_007633 [Mythimna loreyi]